jgi:MYXO-CTERM domain-containing protein
MSSAGKVCWQLIVDFVEQTMAAMATQMPDVELRAFISFFTCGPSNNNPRNTIVTVPRWATYLDTNYWRAITRLRSISQGRMQGTCPSEGARKILGAVRTTRRPSVYLIVTDGRVQDSDLPRYRSTMSAIMQVFSNRLPAQGDRVVCAATIGNSVLESVVKRYIGSECVFPVVDFPLLKQAAPKLAVAMAPRHLPLIDRSEDSSEYEAITWEPTASSLRPSPEPSATPHSKSPTLHAATNTPTVAWTSNKPSSTPTMHQAEQVNAGNQEQASSAGEQPRPLIWPYAVGALGGVALLVAAAAWVRRRRNQVTKEQIAVIQAMTF